MERARRVGYDLFIVEAGRDGAARPSKLFFGRSARVRQRTYELRYGRSLIEFQPELTTANQVAEVTVTGWDARGKQPITATAKRSDLRTRGVGAAGGQEAIEQAFKKRKEIVSDIPVESEHEARRLALETLEDIAKDMVRGSGATVGLPDLRAGTVLRLEGLGRRFSGRYFVTATTHSIGNGGYTTRFECRREELAEGGSA
jgi:phage protein D